VAPTPEPKDKDQVNLTDEESRIMPISGGGFEQGYNAQASVDNETMLVQQFSVKAKNHPSIEHLLEFLLPH
jgi:hypothetical protein